MKAYEAGARRELVVFERFSEADDGYGGRERVWSELETASVSFIYQSGSEVVDGAALQGVSRYKIKARPTSAVLTLTPRDRMRDTRRDVIYNIRKVDAIANRAWVFIEVESGVAV